MNRFLLFVFLPLLVISCGKGPETTVVDSDPLLPSDTTANQDSVSLTGGDDFTHIKIGEVSEISSVDPLFAATNSEFRIINLVYDRLTAIDENGNVAPSLARSWNVNPDSTRFTFHLKPNVYYHNTNAFVTGIGRKLIASDVRYVFQRMALIQVPDNAADMFKSIIGFNAYHNEQTYVKNPAKRVIQSIQGIVVENDSTITFSLNKKTPGFLKKLAHPLASVYARESVPGDNSPIQRAAGTGPYYYVKKESDRLILARNNNYMTLNPGPDRVDFISGQPPRQLFQSLSNNELDAIIEPAPSTLISVTDNTGKLSSKYNSLDLRTAASKIKYQIFYNLDYESADYVNALADTLDISNLITPSFLGSVYKERVSGFTREESTPSNSFTVTHTEHPFETFLIDRFATRASSSGYSISMNPSYAISEQVTFTTRLFPDTVPFITWEAPLYILSTKRVEGIRITNRPWKLDLTNVTIAEVQ